LFLQIIVPKVLEVLKHEPLPVPIVVPEMCTVLCITCITSPLSEFAEPAKIPQVAAQSTNEIILLAINPLAFTVRIPYKVDALFLVS